MPITVLELALHRGVKEDTNGNISMGALEDVGLPFMGGCLICGAGIAAYNACPSKLSAGAAKLCEQSGYLKCASGCIDEDGFATVEEANANLFGE